MWLSATGVAGTTASGIVFVIKIPELLGVPVGSAEAGGGVCWEDGWAVSVTFTVTVNSETVTVIVAVFGPAVGELGAPVALGDEDGGYGRREPRIDLATAVSTQPSDTPTVLFIGSA